MLSSVMQPHSGGKAWIQRNEDGLEKWACTKLTRFNKAKCNVLHTGQSNAKHKYRLDGGGIESSPEEKDLAGLVDWKLSMTAAMSVGSPGKSNLSWAASKALGQQGVKGYADVRELRMLLIRLVHQTLPQLQCPSVDGFHINVFLSQNLSQDLRRSINENPPQQGDGFCPAWQATMQVAFLATRALVQLLMTITPGLFPQGSFAAILSPAWGRWVVAALTQVQELPLGFVEPKATVLRLSIQPILIPLHTLPALQQINIPAEFGVICN
ncbi:hypothetical protein DUI87_11267 [Hirundo rustica rustica]|uniref:Uncharacterized protein n=1 Tax=Hirundo rustica rustica TaxID=333673 RepID=A0A3M0KG33_HIRRU|nr:hypothetical protein DUI87_11267 [Hirundo rustica rustica]